MDIAVQPDAEEVMEGRSGGPSAAYLRVSRWKRANPELLRAQRRRHYQRKPARSTPNQRLIWARAKKRWRAKQLAQQQVDL